MELNAEQIKKALEICGNEELDTCKGCPYAEDYTNCNELIAKAALFLITSQEQRIKELSEEAESWRIDAENYRNERDELRTENNVLSDQIDQIVKDLEEIIDYAIEAKKKERRDTVIKMRELIKERCENLFSGLDACIIIDDVANRLILEDINEGSHT